MPCRQASAIKRGILEHAQQIAGHASPKTTKLYDRTADRVTVAGTIDGPLLTRACSPCL